jgi:TDG/mug DNA glycosylase family protein
MATETILVGDATVKTLRELIKPGLRAVFVGINPSPTSVESGHYYQGTHGLRLWSRLHMAGIASNLPAGRQDDAAFVQGLGFADLVRRPTTSADDLSKTELARSVPDLLHRLMPAYGALVIFVYALAHKAANRSLIEAGWSVARMPGPYASRHLVATQMAEIAESIRHS